MTATLKSIKISGIDKAFAVVVNGKEVGIITKGKDSKATKNPWKAYKGIGFDSKMVAYFFNEDGGKDAAVNAVVNA